ncbi:single-stranded DNA-binding protein [Deinococcus carri]|uniref:Single-stranded DNA-binding protein n=1 Tax=Deinococcus carri TaxID=1211323 RepID=A0ABP9W7Y9_9DEIO
MPLSHAEFGSVVDLIGCVARSPEPRGDCLAFVVAGEELVRFSDGNVREMAFYQRCLIDRNSPDVGSVLKGAAVAATGRLWQTRNSMTQKCRVEVKVSRVLQIERPASDLIRDGGGGYRLRNGYQQVLVSGRAGGAAQHGLIENNTELMNVSLAVPDPIRDEVHWVDVCSYGSLALTNVVKGQRVVVQGRLWNRVKTLPAGHRHTFTVVEASQVYPSQVHRQTA